MANGPAAGETVTGPFLCIPAKATRKYPEGAVMITPW